MGLEESELGGSSLLSQSVMFCLGGHMGARELSLQSMWEVVGQYFRGSVSALWETPLGTE